MAEHLYRRAQTHEQKGRQYLDEIFAATSPGRAFGLAFLINLYTATLKKVEAIDFDVFVEDGELTMEDKQQVLMQTADEMEISPASAMKVFEEIFEE